ncbi:hypothetical protein Ciccas_000282 [Cichlidogyrus casuarinus]|uniref:Uncharacterized protein n=1 Tax=Cichlidogyrus casuarinus TaxID=1844966 RepID=A0ABD2QNR9_9PLAT
MGSPNVHLISGLEETLFYLLHALGLGETNPKSPLQSRLQISQSTRLTFEIYEAASTNSATLTNDIYVRLRMNDKVTPTFGILCNKQDKGTRDSHSDCLLSQFVSFLDSYLGFWQGLSLEKYFVDRITPKDDFYELVCQHPRAH